MIPEHVTQALASSDFHVGSDECGYGAWAGPLVVCAAIIPREWARAKDVMDSKAFKGDSGEVKREAVASRLLKDPSITYSLVSIPSHEVDRKGVYKAQNEAHSRALSQVIVKHRSAGATGSYAVIVDGNLKVRYEDGYEHPQALFLPKADDLIAAVAVASIIGKVAHDAWMKKVAAQFPGYDFESNKGYGTAKHQKGIAERGLCELHRRSFGPIRDYLKHKEEGEPLDFGSLFTEDDS